MSEWISLILLKLLDWGIPFSLGLLFRKRVGRFVIALKRRLLNDIITLNIVSIRSYCSIETRDINHDLYDDIKTKLPSPKLLDVFSNGMRMTVPVFGNLRVLVEKTINVEEEERENENVGSIKVTISPESPVRLGIREIPQLNCYAQYSEIIFNAVEKYCMTKSKIIQGYTILETPRIEHFKEEKAFRFEDESLGASIHATPIKLTIIVQASTEIYKAASKYLQV